MKIYVILFLLLSLQVANGQNCIQWKKSMGGSGEDYIASIKPTGDGGTISASTSGSSDHDVTGNLGGEDIWVVKQSSSGAIQWQKSLGSNGNDFTYGTNTINQTGDGGYIVAGGFSQTGNKGGIDWLVIKLNASGDVEWQKDYGGSLNEVATSVEQTRDTGYILAGYTYSSDGDITGLHGSYDAWIVKLDKNGNLQWQKPFGGTVDDWASNVHETADGYIFGGGTNSTNGDVSGLHGDYDYWVVKMDVSGNLIWQKTLGGTGNENEIDFISTTDGGSMIAGYTYSNDGDVTGFHGGTGADSWIVKMDPNGNIQWKKCYGGTNDESPNSIVQTPDNSYLVPGQTISIDGDLSGITAHGGFDGWIMRLDENGTITWQKVMGGSGDDGFNGVASTIDGIIPGGFSATADGDVTSNYGNTDSWVVKIINGGSSVSNVTVCTPELPYVWNGQNYNNSGTYTKHFTNASGCDSTATLLLTVNVLIIDSIIGPKNVCPYTGIGGNATYSINTTGATGYVWTVPTGCSIVSGQGTNSISVHFASTYRVIFGNTITVKVLGNCSSFQRSLQPAVNNAVCKTCSSSTVVSTPPTSPTIFPDQIKVLLSGGLLEYKYKFRAGVAGGRASSESQNLVNGGLYYHWTLPPQCSFDSAATDSSTIWVKFYEGFASAPIKTRLVSGCGSSTDASLTITAIVPATPGAISGPINLCMFTQGTTATYKINKVLFATSYNWQVNIAGVSVSHPGGAGTENDTIITVFFTSLVNSGNIAVTAVAGCCKFSGTKTLTLTQIFAAVPGIISGPTDVCPYMKSAANPSGTPVLYSILKVPAATSYIWYTPPGCTVTHLSPGINDTAIFVVFPSSFTGDTLSVQAVNTCGPGPTRVKTIVRTFPIQPGVITGPSDVCPYMAGSVNAQPIAVQYSIRKVANATSYSWVVTGDATIEHPGSGINDTAILLRFASTFTVGSIVLIANNNCGSSPSRMKSFVKTLPATPGSITGPTDVCAFMAGSVNTQAVPVIYSINSIPGATSYTWVITGGASFQHLNSGSNDTAILVNFESTFISGQVSVAANNNCSSSAFKNLSITRKIPVTPGTITGSIDACPFILSGTDATYTIRKISALTPATSYIWTAPPNATIISHPGGQGTSEDTIITVHFNASYTTGALTVKAVRNCGISGVRSLTITKIPSAPLVSGSTVACPGAIESYNVTYLGGITNDFTFTWTVPTTVGTFTGQGTASISVTFNPTFSGGSISVKESSACGTSQAIPFFITKCIGGIAANAIAPGTKIQNNPENPLSLRGWDYIISPNPSTGKFTLSFNKNLNQNGIDIQVMDMKSVIVYKQHLSVNNEMNFINLPPDLVDGFYFVCCIINGQRINKRLFLHR